MQISNTENVLQISDITDRIEELEGQETPCIAAGWNMAGFLPGSEPANFEDFDDAKQYVIDSVLQAAESAESEEMAENLTAFAEEINLESEDFSLSGPDGLVYWVRDTGETMGLDDEEKEELSALNEFMGEMEGNGGDEKWRGNWYPQSAIHEGYFESAMDELLEDIGEIPKDLPSYLTISVDYDALRQDYTGADFAGETYYFR